MLKRLTLYGYIQYDRLILASLHIFSHVIYLGVCSPKLSTYSEEGGCFRWSEVYTGPIFIGILR
jgi:hypothetical protein